MKKKVLLGMILAAVIVTGVWIINPFKGKTALLNPINNLQKEAKEITPSETLLEYQDPSGFTFSYPDNLSIVKNDIEDESTYADIQLTAKDVNGSLSLKISDSKFTTIEEWLKLNKDASIQVPKEVSLGTLKGREVKLNDRLLLGVLDKGIFFDIEIPRIEEKFWMKVYEKVLANFSFAAPETTSTQTGVSSDDVVFESEEVVE
ncbi:MAG: hypothetical protein ACD_32C00119G0002 [uncultured bacterium]|uniref:Uncharacterized protein n=1 Tax=Candidatus Daviesbacteria bacterium GW2011_GWC2_40_12 TaxID=1618431 RepID=A0A0G0QM16_9BACT|nr:MAG: hypothetical protein ACD_32C00119G0002 [uncultured bacterium]KKR15996.1 MAG: hypothetical protein UT45_C0010G0010 [Candidatus Daviesbacteria bacterium GW2011_GWA2_39_33]KKR24884.1 MAG: hypothetical protein UT54_C0010G0011 [Candidatus Daviesbacteria bacterium GW2011_GWB1_39_5]KKR41484.1 MAG: hypothetical protein UT77_C0010G0010 [Candidatus Daviesbacteria bacterium GW2011_GWC2_40_12]OGE21871.1 MAG: hypothetical protein A2778_03150 [Candidatus Daviesbacteria bacterium RIFCSPHIGHO2_01_FULL_